MSITIGENAGKLQRGVGLTGVVMLGAGSAIGVSIFSVLQPAAQVAGSGLLAAVAIAAVPMILFAIVYSYLASVLPVSGASYEWPRRYLSPFVGFSVAWLRILGNTGAQIVLARVLANYVGMAISISPMLLMTLAITAVFALNYVGIGVAARAQTFLMLLLMAVLAVFFISGAPLISAARIGSPIGNGVFASLAAVPLMISLFLGIESAVEIGEEVRSAERTIPLGITIAIALTAVIYALVAVTALGLIGPVQLALSKAPLLDAAAVPLGHWALPLIVGAATASILKTMNATAMTFSRSLFAMGRAGVLPESIARIHPRFGTPHRAVLLGYVCAMVGLALPSSLVFLLLAVNVPTMLKYLACSLCAVRVAGHHPVISGETRPAPRSRVIAGIGYLAAATAAVIIVVGITADWRPYALIIGWMLLGLIYWHWRARSIVSSVGPT